MLFLRRGERNRRRRLPLAEPRRSREMAGGRPIGDGTRTARHLAPVSDHRGASAYRPRIAGYSRNCDCRQRRTNPTPPARPDRHGGDWRFGGGNPEPSARPPCSPRAAGPGAIRLARQIRPDSEGFHRGRNPIGQSEGPHQQMGRTTTLRATARSGSRGSRGCASPPEPPLGSDETAEPPPWVPRAARRTLPRERRRRGALPRATVPPAPRKVGQARQTPTRTLCNLDCNSVNEI